jgi:hypothetical protein
MKQAYRFSLHAVLAILQLSVKGFSCRVVKIPVPQENLTEGQTSFFFVTEKRGGIRILFRT